MRQSSSTLLERIIALGERRTVLYVVGFLATLGVALFGVSRLVDGDLRRQLTLAAVLSGAFAIAFALVSLLLGFVSLVSRAIDRLFGGKNGAP